MEITNSQSIGVSVPTPSTEAMWSKHYPTSFLVYNLTIPQKHFLLDRGVWSSQAITFWVTSFYPTNPDYLFSIKGFSLSIEDQIKTLIYNVWYDHKTAIFAQNTINVAPEQEHAPLTYTIHTFLDTLVVMCLKIKECEGALTPIFDIYTNGASIPCHTTWLEIHKFLSKRLYYTLLTGQGDMIVNPYTCGVCQGTNVVEMVEWAYPIMAQEAASTEALSITRHITFPL